MWLAHSQTEFLVDICSSSIASMVGGAMLWRRASITAADKKVVLLISVASVIISGTLAHCVVTGGISGCHA